MTPLKPTQPCPDCGARQSHHPFGDILILRCQMCGFAVGADDLHSCAENWDRRARTRTGPDEYALGEFRWRPNMPDEARVVLIGCEPEMFGRLKVLPMGSTDDAG